MHIQVTRTTQCNDPKILNIPKRKKKKNAYSWQVTSLPITQAMQNEKVHSRAENKSCCSLNMVDIQHDMPSSAIPGNTLSFTRILMEC
ncbi:hypothetical protein HYC85_000140 [Camellia sinensis]|uniref:Uncharacterized protein n=1 Tax=Camellia sinensis TaxID=4442 RepID=A0A7J7I2Z5_CAMSI|nr:hypothetical protein HYC85_000140 [Camellia sinensis]